MPHPGNKIHIPLSEPEAVRLLGKVKPGPDMPRPGASKPKAKKKARTKRGKIVSFNAHTVVDNSSVARRVKKNPDESRKISTDLLFTDLDIAFTFLQTARSSKVARTKQRNVANALKAYSYISAKAPELDMPISARDDLDKMLLRLKQELELAGASL